MLKSKKGISPILATLLLIVIAVAAVIVTYAWVMTFTGSQTQQASAILTEENVRFYNASGTRSRTDLTIRNIGTADAKIVRVYLGSSSANLILMNGTEVPGLGTGQTVAAGGSTTITVYWPNRVDTTWEVSTTYYFKVAPETGAPFEFSKKSPAS